MSEKKWAAKAHVRTERHSSTLVLEVDLTKRTTRHEINALQVNIDHYVQWYELLQQILGYYNQPINIEPYRKEGEDE